LPAGRFTHPEGHAIDRAPYHAAHAFRDCVVRVSLAALAERASERRLLMAGSVLVIMPVLVLIVLAQGKFVAGLTQGALKGFLGIPYGGMPHMKNTLMVWGGWEGHEPEACTRLFAHFLEGNGFSVEVTDDLEVYADTFRMREFDLIVQCVTMGELTGSQEAGLLAAVSGGTGLAGWHGGLCDSFRHNTAYQFMTGGQFVAHPGDIIEYKVRVTKPGDPIMEGFTNFTVESEQYYMHVDPNNEVLAVTEFSGEHAPWAAGNEMPVVWKKHWGEGKVFYSAMGHVAAEFERFPEMRTIVERGMLWAAR